MIENDATLLESMNTIRRLLPGAQIHFRMTQGELSTAIISIMTDDLVVAEFEAQEDTIKHSLAYALFDALQWQAEQEKKKKIMQSMWPLGEAGWR